MTSNPAPGYADLAEDLRGEVERLQSELEQAARYGLAVLQEKDTLQAEHEHLESLYEAAKQELKTTKDALFRTQVRQRKVSELGISHEEDFLQEEEVLRNSIGELEVELKNVRLLLEAANVEKEKTEHSLIDVTHQMEQLMIQKKQLRSEVKELKLREAQTMADYSELEEENILLQKQVLQLRQSQVEFEVLKQESRRLHEQVEELSSEVESLNHLKEIVERNSQEMLELLHHEREQRSAMRRELDQRISSESMLALHTLASLGLGSVELNGSEDGTRIDFDDPDNPTIKKIEADFMASSSKAVPGEVGPGGDLFSEVHLSQIAALEQMLEKLEEEKSGIEAALEESKNRLEVAQKEILEQSEKVHQLKVELESSVKVVASLVASHPHFEVLTKQYPTYEAAIQKILQLEEEVQTLHARASELEHQVMQEDMKKNFEEKIKQLDAEIADKKDFISEMGTSLGTVLDTLGKVSEDLIQLYYMACDANCETPNKVMAEYMSVQKPNAELNPGKESSTVDADGTNQNAEVDEKPVAVYIACYKLAEVVAEQLKCTSRAVEHTVALSRQRSKTNGSEEIVELQEQVTKLRAMLFTKREHVLTLRNVLRANKVTAETAMTNLKQRYDHDKAIIASNMARLRNELKVLKEDAAMFASLRVMFAQRCDEYATTIEQLQCQLSAAENERKTMNRLLHMAIQQKLALSARVAELENGRDPRAQRQFRFMRGRGGTLIYSSLPRSEDATCGRPFSPQVNRSK